MASPEPTRTPSSSASPKGAVATQVVSTAVSGLANDGIVSVSTPTKTPCAGTPTSPTRGTEQVGAIVLSPLAKRIPPAKKGGIDAEFRERDNNRHHAPCTLQEAGVGGLNMTNNQNNKRLNAKSDISSDLKVGIALTF